ncbi:hypothetical protein B0T14DRAFT_503287 [Immersiella caudata]|uniref:Nascent polypeptide-associated complex subunit alpha-like UBA domain-containing protein n=1 Tax=Immersiella caudata TaxID=314043 RepID=A0AA39XF89_9PEZI|nr:hypothetical protein B0T14DRAFT_503287 [Immersiella caudata]
MAEDRQPPNAGDIEDEVQPIAKFAEDRKAAAALSKLDARGDDEAPAREVDQEAVKNAMSAIGGGGKPAEKKEVKRIKVDAADIALLVEELELSKGRATELLKSHDGDASEAIRAYVTPAF